MNYYGTDHLGSTALLTDQTGTAVWTADITPFGDKSETTGPFEEAVKYTGKDLDLDTNLHYFLGRWYNAETGRFITQDPIRDGNNWNTYSGNNPLTRIDPNGLKFRSVVKDGFQENVNKEVRMGNQKSGPFLSRKGCYLKTCANIVNTLRSEKGLTALSLEEINKYAIKEELFDDLETGDLSQNMVTKIVERLTGFKLKLEKSTDTDIKKTVKEYEESSEKFFGILKQNVNNIYDHFMNIIGFDNGLKTRDSSNTNMENTNNMQQGRTLERADIYSYSDTGKIDSSMNTKITGTNNAASSSSGTNKNQKIEKAGK